jgi:hypothetical protein
MGAKNIYDVIDNLGFWVRALALTSVFSNMPYARILRAEHDANEDMRHAA